jgi:hypothetical protein
VGLFRSRRRDEETRLDEMALRSLAKRGVDLSRPLRVVHRLSVPGREATEKVATTLGDEGWQVTTDASAFGSAWIVRAEGERMLTPASVAADRERISALARSSGGDYDGWEAQPVP